MEKALFSVSCTTCRVRLAVRNKEAIGEILECPKCGSMVLIVSPEGWVLTEEPPGMPAKNSVAEKPLSPTTPSKNGDSFVGRGGGPIVRETVSEKPPVQPPPVQLPATVSAVVAAPPAAPGKTGLQPVSVLAGQSVTAPVASEAASVVPAVTAAMVSEGFTPFELPEVIAGETFLSSLTRSLWGRIAVLAVSGLLGLAVVVAVSVVVLNRQPATDSKLNDENAKSETTDPVPANAGAKPTLPRVQFNRRWLPEQTLLLIDLRLSRVAKQPSAMNALAFLGPWWQPSSQALLLGLNLGPEQVRRMTWASTDLADCAARCVVVLELEEGIAASRLLPAGQSIGLGANLVARRPQGGPWLHPLLAVDAHTIVTGSEEVLRQLVARGGDAELANGPMELLLKKLSPGGDLAVMVDLSPIRTAAWKLPPQCLDLAKGLDVWPAAKSRWHLLCETPLALGLSVQSADQRRCELGLVCNSETMAEKLRSDVEKLVPDAIRALPTHIAVLKDILATNNLSNDAVDQYKRLLDDLFTALRATRCDTADGIVWVRLGWGGSGLLVSAATAIESRLVIRADWLAAALAIDKTNHRGLLSGLLGYLKAKNPPQFPEGAAGGGLMPPETRLSWIAELLPYLGHADWNVNRAYDWNNANNQPVTRRPLAEVINPALGPAMSPSGYPVTHYVGVAGVGKDAAQLPADDARAGVFGYGRQTRQQDLKRGGTNTIAVLGVQDQCGPWAQGGRATVRPLTQQPYVNGPDGFGSGQADGMVAGMADGSVRFLSKNIDPHVMEQLATVRSGEQVDSATTEPKPPVTDVKPPVADVKPPVADAKPPVVDVKPQAVVDPKLQAKLNVPIAKISLPNMPLADAVQLISAMGNLSVGFDRDAMEELDVSLHDPISIEVADSTVGKTLKEIASQRKMTPVVENGQIMLTSMAEHRENLQPVRFAVSDLTGGDAQAAADLAALVQRLVVPESWQGSGGRGTVEVTPDALRITQTGHVHYQIIVFCEKLRVARGLPTKSRKDPKKFVLTTRTAQAKSSQVTVQKAVATRMELEFYPVGKLLAGQPPAVLIERIKTGLRDATWGEGGAGILYFDPPSQCLIVRQSQPMQIAIEALLTK